MSVSSDNKRQDAGRPTTTGPAGALVALVLALSLPGCCTYKADSSANRTATHPWRCQAARNPNLIFDTPGYAGHYGLAVNSESFSRQPWPAAPAHTSYFSYPNIISYEISIYDNQYIGSNNMPYQSFHHRLRGRKIGMTVR